MSEKKLTVAIQYDKSGNAALSKDMSKGLTQIMKFETCQPNLLTHFVPSALIETLFEYFVLFRSQAVDIFLKFYHGWHWNWSRSHALFGPYTSRGDRTIFKIKIRYSR